MSQNPRSLVFLCPVLFAGFLTSPSSATAATRTVPPAPNACAEQACVAMRSTAELVCADPDAEPATCDVALAELQQCDQECAAEQ